MIQIKAFLILINHLVASTISLTPTGSFSEPSQPVFNNVFTTILDREDVLVEYRVYQVNDDGTETFVIATQDTFVPLLTQVQIIWSIATMLLHIGTQRIMVN